MVVIVIMAMMMKWFCAVYKWSPCHRGNEEVFVGSVPAWDWSGPENIALVHVRAWQHALHNLAITPTPSYASMRYALKKVQFRFSSLDRTISLTSLSETASGSESAGIIIIIPFVDWPVLIIYKHSVLFICAALDL